MVEPIARDKNLRLTLNLIEPVGIMHTDMRKLRQILLNLLSDAIKFTDQAGGTGLGLTVSAQLVELLRGRVNVDSELGAGARFTVELPDAAAPVFTDWTALRKT